MRLIGFLAEKESREAEERAAWEFYLHKVGEGSYADFAAELRGENVPPPPPHRAQEELPAATAREIAARSEDILRRTQPDE